MGGPSVKTPSGGRHFYFQQPAGQLIKNSTGALASDVDVRGDGGFVVVAGAHRFDGRGYTPVHPASLDDFIQMVAQGELPTCPAPSWTTSRRAPAQSCLSSFPAALTTVVTPSAMDDALWAGIRQRWNIAEACNRIAMAPEGTRNDTLNREAFTAGLRVAAGALDANEAFVALADAARVADLDEEEIAKKITASMQRGNASAAQSPALLGLGAPDCTVQWERTHAGGKKRSFKNAMLAVQALGIEVRRNTFSDKTSLGNVPGARALPEDLVGLLSDNVLIFLRNKINDNLDFDPGKEVLIDGVMTLAEQARYDPVQEWLDVLRVGPDAAPEGLAAKDCRST